MIVIKPFIERCESFAQTDVFEAERKKYTDIGFRVVTFSDGDPDADIHNGIRALIKNHLADTD